MENSLFTFGTQYLRGCSPDRSQWAKDLKLISELHFNTIRVWLVWGILEPADGVVDFDYIDEILNLAEKNHLRVIFLFHLHGAPEWAISKYRDCWYVDQYGHPFEPSTRANTPSGGWPGLCPDHAATQHLEERFIKAVCEHVGNRAYAYEPINEPHMWVEFARNPQGYFCFCEETRKCFRLWLQKRYGTLEALSKAWGHQLTDWQDVRPPTWAFGYADTVDWRLFTTENIAALVKRRTAYIRKYSPVQIIAHAWGGGTTTCGQLGAMAFDDWKNSQPLDKWGCSAFPSNVTHACNVGLSMDSTRSAAQGKEFWQSELSAGDVAGGLHRALYATPETFAIWCWEAIGHGSKGLLFWQFRKESYGNESGAYGLTDYQGNPTPRALMASKIAKTLNDHADLFNNVEMPQPEVAILFSYQSVMFNWAEFRNNNLSCDAIGGYYRAFWERNIPVDILHEEFTTAEMLSKYKLVVLPCPFTLPKRVTELLESYVTNGGTVLSDPMLCSWDEHQKLSDHIPGNGLHELFGCEENTVMTGNQGEFDVFAGDRKIPLKNSFVRQTWTITQEAAKALVSNADGQPMMVDSMHGKGHAVLSGISLGNMASQQISISDDFHREGTNQDSRGAAGLILEVADLANVAVPFDVPPNIRVRHMVSKGRHILIAYEFQKKATEGTLEFAAAGNSQWTNLLDDSTGCFHDGKTSLFFTPNEVKVLVI